MFEVIEVVLALIGLCAVAGVVAMCLDDMPEEELPDPYREGLDAAARISALAWEAEQAMYRAAEQAQREESR